MPPLASGAEPGEFLGAATCASSVCHGSIVPREATGVLQNEYVVWSEQDAHARAYKVLLTERSRAIAERLGLGAAHKADLCLDCHATNAPESKRGPRFRIEDGVSCESCHGAAGGWVETHDDETGSHSANVAAGLFPADDPTKNAAKCVSCHVGGADGFVDHRIMAAGHPRMSFDLDTFAELQPSHFRVDGDYLIRKQVTEGVARWASGQAAIVRGQMEALANRDLNRDGGWPDFVLYDCFSCHHEMGSQQAVAGSTFGLPRVHRSSRLMHQEILAVFDASRAASAQKAGAALDAASRNPGTDLEAKAAAVAEGAAADVGRLAAWNPTSAQLAALFDRVTSARMANRYRSYADAEQATFAVQAIVAAQVDAGTVAAVGPVTRALDALFDSTANERGFRIDAFRAALAAVNRARR